jgi:hypothetical protein
MWELLIEPLDRGKRIEKHREMRREERTDASCHGLCVCVQAEDRRHLIPGARVKDSCEQSGC